MPDDLPTLIDALGSMRKEIRDLELKARDLSKKIAKRTTSVKKWIDGTIYQGRVMAQHYRVADDDVYYTETRKRSR